MTPETTQAIPPDQPLKPQPRAIVVGASSGIGAALARELARRGYLVGLVARREQELKAVCSSINTATQVRAFPFVHDVTQFDAVEPLFQQIVEQLGGLDMLIYNAGIMPPVGLDEYDFDKDRQQIEVNLLGGMAWLNCAARRFQAAGRGHLVAISSVAGDRGRRLNPGYHTSKGGLTIFMESLRNRLSQHGVQVTTIKPGFVDTAMLENAAKTFWVISPDTAARKIIAAAEKGRATVYVPAQWGLVMLIIRHIPSLIFRRLSI